MNSRAEEAERGPAISQAAMWIISQHGLERRPTIIPALRHQFELTAVEAVDAIRLANSLTGEGGDYDKRK